MSTPWTCTPTKTRSTGGCRVLGFGLGLRVCLFRVGGRSGPRFEPDLTVAIPSFDRFNLKYNPFGQSRLREVFIKQDNLLRGRWLAELTAEVFADLEASKYQVRAGRGRGARGAWDAAGGAAFGHSPGPTAKSTHPQHAEYRVSIYGRKRVEWDTLAAWVCQNRLYSDNVAWLIQVGVGGGGGGRACRGCGLLDF